MADWLLPSFTVLPAMLGSFLLVGVPWALVALPRADWRDRALVMTLGLALGATLWTAAMFLLGTFLRLTLAGALLGGFILALWGWPLAWLRYRGGEDRPPEAAARQPLAWWERLIALALAVAVIVRVVHTAYWPFTAYDPLWVYGYNGRLFTLMGRIPAEIGYYPQMLPLSYTYGQLLWGGINDHAARVAVPIFGLGSILAAYLLGARLRGRGVGLLTAALWTFYPHHAEWARFGDLEVPLTFTFTLAALFFLLAWREGARRRWRYAVLAGLLLGAALWTKPTAGALVWGMGLVLLLEAVRLRLNWGRLWLKVKLILAVGLAAAPIGGMWYLRNLLLGHPPLVFPPAYWLTQAQRSGQELGWPLLILALLALYLLLEPPGRRPDWRLIVPGTALLILGALPSAGLWAGTPTHRLRLEEIAVMLAGAALYGLGVWRWWRAAHPAIPLRRLLLRSAAQGAGPQEGGLHVALGVTALVLPYWVTWFYSYSYHPRLAFAITPLQLLLVAMLVAGIAPRLAAYVRPRRRKAMAAVALLAWMVPGLWLTARETATHLALADLPDDDAKHRASNYALFRTVEHLREEAARGPIHVLAPGALRLPFFFPEVPIETGPVRDLSALDDRVTHYIRGVESEHLYRTTGALINPVRALPGRLRLAQRLYSEADVNFNYDLFAVNTALRWVQPTYNGVLPQPVIYPGFAELQGYAITGLDFWPGRRIVLLTFWRVLGRTEADYTIYLHVTDGEGETPVATWDHIPGNGEFPTYLWEPGEFVVDELSVYLYEDVPPGDYQVRVGLYDFSTGERVPVQVGDETRDGAVLIEAIHMLPGPPEGQ